MTKISTRLMLCASLSAVAFLMVTPDAYAGKKEREAVAVPTVTGGICAIRASNEAGYLALRSKLMTRKACKTRGDSILRARADAQGIEVFGIVQFRTFLEGGGISRN